MDGESREQVVKGRATLETTKFHAACYSLSISFCNLVGFLFFSWH
eukprot:SAG31_NODE_35991_length_317_cov_1.183486_2_plen_44_part_01